MYKNVYLKKGKDEPLRRYHPWVFSGAIHHRDEGIQVGEIVRVLDDKENFIASGHYEDSSIAVRVLSFEDIDIDNSFWISRITAALQMRQEFGIADNPNNTTFRLVNGEGDLLPGLIIDCYGKTAVMQAHSVGMHKARKEICKNLLAVMGERIQAVYYKSETTLQSTTEHFVDNDFLYGNAENNITIENGMKFHVDWLKGQKTGFFIDQRENRSLLGKYSCGKKVLNMFCYTGGFSVYALKAGATLVHSVDSSAKAIELTKRNVALNFPEDSRHEGFCTDAFRFFSEHRDNYDVIVLDPPAFAKHRTALKNALKGYTRINKQGIERINPGGILFTFSCSQAVSKENFRTAVFTAAAQANRNVKILHQLHQPADHPISIYHPEGEYLKGFVLYVE